MALRSLRSSCLQHISRHKSKDDDIHYKRMVKESAGWGYRSLIYGSFIRVRRTDLGTNAADGEKKVPILLLTLVSLTFGRFWD
jgi:hypothetical protein